MAGISANAVNGQKRILYSLRHTALTFRPLSDKNVDSLTLARNPRISVEMVEKFYSSNLSAGMNNDMLPGRRE